MAAPPGIFALSVELLIATPELFVFRLSKDKIVGGSCIGSPAKISFLALKMGIQHTCGTVQRVQVHRDKICAPLPWLEWPRQ